MNVYPNFAARGGEDNRYLHAINGRAFCCRNASQHQELLEPAKNACLVLDRHFGCRTRSDVSQQS